MELFAVEYLSDEMTPPDTVDNIESPLGNTFNIGPTKKPLFQNLKKSLQNLPPFFRDSKLSLNLRSYYFYRNNRTGNNSTAFTIGGSISLES